MNTTRVRSRSIVGSFVSLVLAAVLMAGSAWSAEKSAGSVILLIGDGMGSNALKAASISLRGADGKLFMQGLPVKGSLCTTSFGGGTTDSAAAGTALATGYKTKNGMLGMTHDGSLVRSILEACRDAGKATGLVATSAITDATPASFATHVSGRGMQYDVADQLLAARVNVIMGGGKSLFLERKGEAYVGVDFIDADDKKISSTTDRVRWTADMVMEHGIKAPPGAVKASIWIWLGQTGVEGYFDDFSFEKKKGAMPANLVVNGGFEGGDASGWNGWSGCTVGRDGSSVALRVDDGGGCDQAFPVEAGAEYTFSYRSRVGDAYAGMAERLTAWDRAGRNGYARIEKKTELAGAKGPYLLGLFQPGALENTPAEPSLTELAQKAIDVLKGNPAGFFLMVEGSQIDWAAHANDATELVRRIGVFDDTVKAAVAFAKKRGDVLVIVCADHETGGVGVEGKGKSDLRITFSTGGHTSTVVPLFAYGPGSKAFAGPHDNTEVPGLIAKALKLAF